MTRTNRPWDGLGIQPPDRINVASDGDVFFYWWRGECRADWVYIATGIDGSAMVFPGEELESVRFQDRDTLTECFQEVGELLDTDAMLLDFFEGDADKVRTWYYTENPLLGGVRPMDMVYQGSVAKLRKFVETQLAENRPDVVSVSVSVGEMVKDALDKILSDAGMTLVSAKASDEPEDTK